MARPTFDPSRPEVQRVPSGGYTARIGHAGRGSSWAWGATAAEALHKLSDYLQDRALPADHPSRQPTVEGIIAAAARRGIVGDELAGLEREWSRLLPDLEERSARIRGQVRAAPCSCETPYDPEDGRCSRCHGRAPWAELPDDVRRSSG